MGYTIEQLMDNKAYKALCAIIIDMAKDDGTSLMLESILYEGQVGNFSLKSSIDCRDNPNIESARRISMAYLLIDSPDVFDYISHNNINLFHGTNSNALPTILKYGLNSVNDQKRKGIHNCTGEEWSRENGERNYVSFTDVLDTAIDYSTMMPENNDLSSFSVIIGTCTDDVRKIGIVPVVSALPEIGTRGVLDSNSIKIICVPDDKVSFVKRLVGDRKIKVMGFSGINDRFYYFDDLYLLEFYSTLIDEYKNKVLKKNKFKNEEVAEVAASRSFDRILNIVNKISSFFKGDDYDRHIK